MVTYNHQDDGLQTAISVSKPTNNHLMVTYNHQDDGFQTAINVFKPINKSSDGDLQPPITTSNASCDLLPHSRGVTYYHHPCQCQNFSKKILFNFQIKVGLIVLKTKGKKSLAALWRDISENNSAPVDETPQSSGW